MFRKSMTALIVGIALAAPAMPAAAAERKTPSTLYYNYFGSFYDGEYRDALRGFQDESRGSIKTPQSRWIDSICYETMCGECYYQMGALDKALEHYSNALRLFCRFSDWMVQVRFAPTIRVASVGKEKPVPWGASSRQSRLGLYKDELIVQGRVDVGKIGNKSAIIQQASMYSITPHEIVRATTLALRRRAELLGPVGQYDPLSQELVAVFSRPVGPPNHWSQCWVDVQRGLALIGGGRAGQAIGYLQRAVLAAGEFDHPMTGIALFELGRQKLLLGKYDEASQFFAEATYSAVNYPDYGILEEAFRYAALTHIAANRKGFFAPLNPAIQWAKIKNLRQLQASLLLSAAENYSLLGDLRQAAAALDAARATVGRRDMGTGRIGARHHYLSALVAYQNKEIPAGNAALNSAMDYMRHGSAWLFQIDLADQLYTGGALTTRSALQLFAEVLRDPLSLDWTLQPMESFAALTTPQPLPMEHWFEAALERSEVKEIHGAMDIAEQTRRRRFFASLEFGGRLESLRWILEAPENRLAKQALLQRQDIMSRYPEFERLSRRSTAIREELAKQPLVPKDPTRLKEQTDKLTELGAAGIEQEAILRVIALRREPAELVFPPLQSAADLQKSIPDRHAVLAFFATSRRLYAFLLNNEQCIHWQIGSTPALLRQTQAMLREMGQFGQNHQINADEISSEKWRQPARQVLETLLKGSRADFSQPFDELAVVPDGFLWYLPFEALQVKVDDRLHSLIARFRIRYAPTLSLCAAQGWGRNPTGNTAVMVGKLYPRDEVEVARGAFEQLTKVVPGAVMLDAPSSAPSAVYAALCDRLIVLDDLILQDNPYAWYPASLDRGREGGSLADWMLLPWDGPDVVVLPGFHTTAEDALKNLDRRAPGGDVFLTVCGLMAGGSRTLLLSRWRTGGQSSFDLVREFAQELPRAAPADAWQRAVLLANDSRLDLDAEPRVKRTASSETPKAVHPFFWAGYMLVDCGAAPANQQKQ
ncbi:MAG: CHAT domain-containing protein [Pirellulales bacterium]|nr:CHAT domain-containing protein [Pirellulales bacterium]